MAKEIKKITETHGEGDKTFKGKGIEGKKSLDELKAERERISANAETEEERAALAEIDAMIKKAEEEDATVTNKAELLKDKKASLTMLMTEDKDLTEKEDARGFVDGHIVMERKKRREKIASLDHEVANG